MAVQGRSVRCLPKEFLVFLGSDPHSSHIPLVIVISREWKLRGRMPEADIPGLSDLGYQSSLREPSELFIHKISPNFANMPWKWSDTELPHFSCPFSKGTES